MNKIDYFRKSEFYKLPTSTFPISTVQIGDLHSAFSAFIYIFFDHFLQFFILHPHIYASTREKIFFEYFLPKPTFTHLVLERAHDRFYFS